MFRHPTPGTFFFIPEILLIRKGLVAWALPLQARKAGKAD